MASRIFTLSLLTMAAVRASGPDHWADDFPHCGGDRQSPIDITGAVYDESLGEFQFVNFDETMQNAEWKISNNGHSVLVTVPDGVFATSGGGLPGSYKVAQFHFHWGSSDGQGSEHLLEDRRFPMELHIVHYNSEYSNATEAQANEDGPAVLGFFFKIDDKDNINLDGLIAAVQSVQEKLVKYPVTPFPLTALIANDLDNFYRYSGSLTTPPCDETVVWTLFHETVKLSEEQMAAFRGLVMSDGEKLVDNFRPVQPLNGRTIGASFQQEDDNGGEDNGDDYGSDHDADGHGGHGHADEH